MEDTHPTSTHNLEPVRTALIRANCLLAQIKPDLESGMIRVINGVQDEIEAALKEMGPIPVAA
jgi:hypothetical protein